MSKFLYPIKKLKIEPWIKYFLMKKSKTILPKEYQKVAYIESSGTQYINTNYTPNSNTKYKLTMKFNELGTISYLISARSTNYRNDLYLATSNKLSVGYGNEYKNSDFIVEKDIKYNIVSDKNLLYVNKNLVWTSTEQEFINTVKAVIFARNYNDEIGSFISAKLYSCKIYENDILVRNFIPCFRKEDNEVGLYDTVNKEFYTNAGTGTFNYGNEEIEVEQNSSLLFQNKAFQKSINLKNNYESEE